jgi:hypothetical protein
MSRGVWHFLFFFVAALIACSGTAYAQGGGKAKKGAAAAPTAAPAADPDPAPAAAPAQPAAPPETAAEKEEDAEDAAHHHAPRTWGVALHLDKLSKFELGPGTFIAEFIVIYKCDAEPCKPEPDVTNGKITSKDKLGDEPGVKVYRMKAELEAQIDLSEFPFDKQTLPILFTDKDENIRLVDDPTIFKAIGIPSVNPEIRLAGWDLEKELVPSIKKQKLGSFESDDLSYEMKISRPRIASFFKSLVPAFFMVFVAGFTLLLKPKSAAGRLTTATGALMTVVMFHLSATSSLPPLGYLTRLDKFMIATYCVYLVNILFAVGIVRLDEKKNEKMAELAYLVAGGVVPGVALLAWVTVFLKVA